VNAKQAFVLLEKFELKMAELYRVYSELYAMDAQAAALFYRMSLEEKNHVNVIAYQKRVVNQNPRLFGDVEMDVEEIQEEIARVEALAKVRVTPPVDEALRTALELENGAAERHFRLSAIQSNPEAAKHLMSLGTADKQHYEALKAFARGRGLL
jgi:rubrerythrin